MKILTLLLLFACSVSGECQIYKQNNFERSLYGLTTIINVKKSGPTGNYSTSFGTGFFYHKYSEPLPEFPSSRTNAIDSSLKSIWLITNKHVIFGRENYQKKIPNFPDEIDFYLRKILPGIDHPVWDTIHINKVDLKILTKTHTDSLIDVVAIDVTRFVLPRLMKGNSLYYYGAISKANFPKAGFNLNGWETNVGDDILAIGYPQGFYDMYNLFPTIKSGIIASKWKAKYNGNPFFLIDCKLFPGSSGSIIISKYTKFGDIYNQDFDFFQFLGIYSGEYFRQKETVDFDEMTITKKESYNTGNVWYYYLIEEIIK